MKVSHILSLLLFLCAFQLLNAQQLTVSFSTTPVCNHDGTITATVTGGIPPYSYTWYSYNGCQSANLTNSATITGLSGGQYWLNVSDASASPLNGYASINLNFPFQVQANIQNAQCPNNNGSVSLSVTGAAAPISYLWANGATTSSITGLAPGAYNVTITDGNGCSLDYSDLDSMCNGINIYSQTNIQGSTSTTPSVCSSPTGTATITNVTGGLAPYTYYWNSVPPQTTATASNLAVGYYDVTITDAQGCNRTYYYNNVYDNSNMWVSTSVTPTVCNTAVGSATALGQNGVAPYSYSWYNGATSSTINNLAQGLYQVKVTDAAGCVRQKWEYVYYTSPVNVQLAPTNPSCVFTPDGVISASATGGTAPYSYLWGTGATTATISNLTQGWYGVTVTDANGCLGYNYAGIATNNITPCAAIIQGTLFDDANADCQWNSGTEQILPSAWIQCTPNNYYTYANNAQYTLVVNPSIAANYTLTPYSYNSYITPSCAAASGISVATSAGNTYTGKDFPMIVTPVEDLAIYGSRLGAAFPGGTFNYYIHVGNNGTVAQSPTVSCTHDPNLNFLGANPTPISYNPVTHTITWSLSSLSMYQYQSINCQFSVPTTAVIGTAIPMAMSVTPVANDVTPTNNSYTDNFLTVGPYDPNMIEVSPKGTGTPGFISVNDSILEYVVHFQNTGNWPAQNVVIKQLIDSDLNIVSIEKLTSSHACTIAWEGNNTLAFNFNNIQLPDSFANEPGSHGFVTYKVHIKPNLQPLTPIKADADIYFDYNLPIKTNEVTNTIKLDTRIEKASAKAFEIVPNPAENQIRLHLLSPAVAGKIKVTIASLAGSQIQSIETNLNTQGWSEELELKDIAAGMYILTIENNGKQWVEKLLVK